MPHRFQTINKRKFLGVMISFAICLILIDMQVKFEPDWLSVITVSAAGPRPDGIRGSRGNSDHLLGTLHSKECLYVFLVHCCSVSIHCCNVFLVVETPAKQSHRIITAVKMCD